MKKIMYLLAIITVLLSFSAFPIQSQAGDKGTLKEVVKIHYKLPPELEFARGDHGKPVAQCTVTQNDNVNDYGLTGWHMPAGGLTYKIANKTLPANINFTEFASAIGRATSTWESASYSEWNYGGTTTIKRSAADGVNVVAFGGASGGIAVTRTWYWTDTGEVAESDVIFSSNLAWSITNPGAGDCGGATNAYDVQNIATHEFGHQVGLNDLYNSADRDLTMYGYGTMKELKKDTLGSGDISGAHAI